MKKYAFIDRDGTLIFEPQDTYQIDSLEKLQILPGVIEGLQALQNGGYRLVMISNQDGLGTDSFQQAGFDAPQQKMLEIFAQNNVSFDQIFICPHLPEDNCTCRKPKTGLVKDFLATEDIDCRGSFVCGDRPTDAAFAKNIGVRSVMMPTNGNFLNALRQARVV